MTAPVRVQVPLATPIWERKCASERSKEIGASAKRNTAHRAIHAPAQRSQRRYSDDELFVAQDDTATTHRTAQSEVIHHEFTITRRTYGKRHQTGRSITLSKCSRTTLVLGMPAGFVPLKNGKAASAQSDTSADET